MRIEKIEKLQGVGLFNKPENVSTKTLGDLTLIYAENGRGKSTLSSIFRAAQNNNADAIRKRKTIDQDTFQLIQLKHTDGSVTNFANGRWNVNNTNLAVFDSEFIRENVHSGSNITSDNRKNLLSFALGKSAVDAQNNENQSTVRVKDLNKRMKQLENELSPYHPQITLIDFINLPENPNIDDDILKVTQTRDEALGQQSILRLPLPETIVIPESSIDEIIEASAYTVDEMHEHAEKRINQHLSEHTNGVDITWLSEGFRGQKGDQCPYCANNLNQDSIAKWYRHYFNEEYRDLDTNIAELIQRVKNITSPEYLESIHDKMKSSISAVSSWNESGSNLEAPTLPDIDRLKKFASDFQQKATDLLERKRSRFGESLVSESIKGSLETDWLNFSSSLSIFNESIETANREIELFKKSLEANDPVELDRKISSLEIQRNRYSEVVSKKVKSYQYAEAELVIEQQNKEQAREDLRTIMNSTINRYFSSINSYLRSQRACFSIVKQPANFNGGKPRANYGLEVRGTPVDLSGTGDAFGISLSEGDRRTMGFAFFLAAMQSVGDLRNTTIVVDDPMTSLDRNRRKHTVNKLIELLSKGAQLVVLAHDPTFLLELKNQARHINLSDDSTALQKPAIVSISLKPHVQDKNKDPYTEFYDCNLEEECESKFARNYRRVYSFVYDNSLDRDAAANAIRPMLEGYLHRRFPNMLPENCMFGEAITTIEKADKDSPLSRAHGIVDTLREISNFGSGPHHDTNPDLQIGNLSDEEVRFYCTEALALVHG